MKRDLRVSFSDYVQATEPATDNSMRPRTQGCIALLPVGNSTGSVKMLCLGTNTIVTRDQFVSLPMPSHLIALLSTRAKEQGFTRGGMDGPFAEDRAAVLPLDVLFPQPDMLPINQQQLMQPLNIEAAVDAGVDAPAGEPDEDGIAADDVVSTPPPRRSQRLAEKQQTNELTLVGMTVRAALRERGEEARNAIMAELQQMVAKSVWHGVHLSSLSNSARQAVIRSKMFLKDKHSADGVFEKFKARLVAGGDQQDKNLYENLSSPTAATCSVMAVAAIAAAENRKVMVIDIGGAFLNAKMPSEGISVHVSLDKVMAGMLCEIDPGNRKFVCENGRMIVRLDKALYGCVEAAKLWFDDLTLKLMGHGLCANHLDVCVFNKTVNNTQLTVVVHVDDLLVTSTSKELLMDFDQYLRSVYPETKTNMGDFINYLGMTFNFSVSGEVKVTMANCIDDILKNCNVTGTKRTPAADTLFDVRENASKVGKEDGDYFRSNVAKMLYLAKRVRPECLTCVAFLATRVQCADEDDMAKLRRLLEYLRGTRERGIVLRVGQNLEVNAFIDAAYGVHSGSGKSHTGCVIVLGEAGPVFAKSTKQRIVTKSSTEAELVGVSDTATQAIHLRNFLVEQGYKTGPAIIHQDNLSCMALLKRGGPSSERSRHINIRHFWLKERVDTGEIVVRHLGTEKMFANALTKPLQGMQFLRERKELTNWTE